ncbi:MAG: exodeoxyribonuclease VII large subunit [Lachnospiraceae bacterium]|nr:exodeoxyribonuclease VII large subunit [Lachnospiraceae bacterium]
MSVYTVEQLNNYILSMFRNDYLLHDVSVRGEISNCKYHSSGHIYFTLKDAASNLSCVMFASNASKLKFTLENGMEAEVRGSVENYVRDGKYQLYAKSVIKGDAGNLAVRFEELKKRLREEGLFDEDIKQPIPKEVKKLGIVTASTGAAVRDIISISKRRNPYVELILYPAQVQGEGAKESIVKGIDALTQYGVDVIIVGRGGGSMEDLWAFNEEEVAQAIFNCPIPVISAVGHETDFTIADFVADLRAPTPSAAAELAVSEIGPVLDAIEDYSERIYYTMDRIIRLRRMESEQFKKRILLASPKQKINAKRMECARFEDKFSGSMQEILKSRKNMLSLYIERMKRVSVLDRLNGGLAYVSDENHKRMTSVGQFEEGKNFELRLKDGVVHAQTVTVTRDDLCKKED